MVQDIPELKLEPEVKEKKAQLPQRRRARVPPVPTDCYQYYYGGRDMPFTIPKHTVIVPEGLILSMLRRLGSDPDRRW